MRRVEIPMYIRVTAILVGGAILIASTIFSVNGFDITVPDMLWMGWLLGASIFGIEIIWNKAGRGNLTLGIVGIAAYSYGIYTNIKGILLAQGLNVEFELDERMLFPIIFAFFLEVSAEPLLILGFTGEASSDPISEMLGNLSGFGRRSPVMERPTLPDGDTGPVRVMPPVTIAERRAAQFRPNGSHPVMMKRR